ncbi:YegP family protein [Phaeacidiphilus oryzae]|jgi:uncharacterized protein YegP (UPF0339 family)|uniref:YegP family protein n=1 Tax=Phaeacidiphilus oryzae TaxID=348818 RepID=UPI000562645E|nr:YegP family protein [Phaeacidiphilus oryzae]
MPGKFEVYREGTDKTAEYRFRLKTTQGEVIAVSAPYDSREACERSIESVRKCAPYAKLVDSEVEPV